MTLDAALIAGGQSRRMGTDKAFLDWNGEPLWVVQLRKLVALAGVDRVWLSSNAEQPFPDHLEGVSRVNDSIKEIGPLGALKTVFEQSMADRVLVLAVDMPLIDPALLQNGVAKIDGRWEPLAAIYPREAMLKRINHQVEKGELSLQRLLDQMEQEALIVPIYPEEPSLFTNLNTRDEWAAIQPGTVDDRTLLIRYENGQGFSEPVTDFLAAEEPLEVRVNGKAVAVMMRTPGHDEELAVGFLYTEGVIERAEDVIRMERDEGGPPSNRGNRLDITLKEDQDLSGLTRHVFTSSSCGVCGKATIDSVFQGFPPLSVPASRPDPDLILSLPDQLRSAQSTFDRTGGLHASALFARADGELRLLREDVGRHNALDKVIGRGLIDQFDFSELILLVSGRISFELMQKALSVRIPIVAGISAPSSLAVDLARRSGQVLIGFLRDSRFNLYTPSD